MGASDDLDPDEDGYPVDGGASNKMLLGALAASGGDGSKRRPMLGPRIFWTPEEDRILLRGLVRNRVLNGPPLMRAGPKARVMVAVDGTAVAAVGPRSDSVNGGRGCDDDDDEEEDEEEVDEDADGAVAGLKVKRATRESDLWVKELRDSGALPHPDKSCWVRVQMMQTRSTRLFEPLVQAIILARHRWRAATGERKVSGIGI